MKITARIFIVALCVILTAALLLLPAAAEEHLDEIQNFTIDITVNDDATLTMDYHVEWKVLDSESEGPLEWVRIGIPNYHYVSFTPCSDTIHDMSIVDEEDIYARIDLDRSYSAGETVTFDFRLVQDYMYQVNMLEDGYTVYEFTPGWFDEIDVKTLTVRWNSDKVCSWSPSCEMTDGRLVWQVPLAAGERFKVSITYPNDAYGFDISKNIVTGGEETSMTWFSIVLIGVVVLMFFPGLRLSSLTSYAKGSGLGQEKITRTKIVYWPECQGCGAPRKGDEENCEYCGRNLIKSKEVVTEEKVKQEDAGALNHKTEGTYRYTSEPNTYIRVNVRLPRNQSGKKFILCPQFLCVCLRLCLCMYRRRTCRLLCQGFLPHRS